MRSVIAPRRHKTKLNKFRGHIIVQNVPEDTRNNFKGACVRRGRTMRDVLILFMRAYAKRYGTLSYRKAKHLDKNEEDMPLE